MSELMQSPPEPDPPKVFDPVMVAALMAVGAFVIYGAMRLVGVL